jgi:energy-coupling factor transporter transmembrane protein EcfT
METPLENKKIEIEQETLKHLNTTRKWAMFLAIIGFIILGLIVIVGLIAGTFLTAFNSGGKDLGIPESLMFVPILLLAVIYFFPVLFLFRFSKHTSHAVHTLDKLEFHKAIKNLKSCFVYIGVLIIIILSLYIVVLVVAGSSMAFLKGL